MTQAAAYIPDTTKKRVNDHNSRPTTSPEKCKDGVVISGLCTEEQYGKNHQKHRRHNIAKSLVNNPGRLDDIAEEGEIVQQAAPNGFVWVTN